MKKAAALLWLIVFLFSLPAIGARVRADSGNDPPVAYDQAVSTGEDAPVAITLTASDADGDALSYHVVTPTSHGSLSGTEPYLTYTPNLDYSGLDSFTFRADDGVTDSNIATVSITVTARASHQCRMWGMVSPAFPSGVVMSQLVSLTDSLKNLGGGPHGTGNVNGWGLVYYDSGVPVVARGQPKAYTDSNFNVAAQALASSGGQVGMGHVRNAASGAVNIPDPHPFVRVRGGKTWTFAHNGVLNIANLKALIGPTYLSYFTPSVGSDWNDPDVVDSDLYLIYVLKCVEESGWDVKAGIAEAETEIYGTDSSSNANFLLSDGTSMWGYRKSVDSSHTLYYKYDDSQHYSAIASQPPEGSGLGDWVSMSNFNLVEISADSPPVLYEDIRSYGLQADDFTVVVLPDTQFYSKSYPSIFDSQTQWVVDHEEDLNIVFVTHEGDIVNDNEVTQWQRADHSMSILDTSDVPWGVLPGNHDMYDGSTKYNTYFGYGRFSGEDWYGGAYQNVNTNNYELFTGGLDDYLIFHFQYQPSNSVLVWANATIASYPDRRVIVTTHDYMNTRWELGHTDWKQHLEQVRKAPRGPDLPGPLRPQPRGE